MTEMSFPSVFLLGAFPSSECSTCRLGVLGQKEHRNPLIRDFVYPRHTSWPGNHAMSEPDLRGTLAKSVFCVKLKCSNILSSLLSTTLHCDIQSLEIPGFTLPPVSCRYCRYTSKISHYLNLHMNSTLCIRDNTYQIYLRNCKANTIC